MLRTYIVAWECKERAHTSWHWVVLAYDTEREARIAYALALDMGPKLGDIRNVTLSQVLERRHG